MQPADRPFKEVQLQVPWGHVAAKVYGSSVTKRVLLVHGVLDNAGSFDRLITFLPKEYQYVSIDLPGHGYSTAFPAGVPLEFFNYVHTIGLVLDGLGWNTCVYIGHSMGGQLGLYYSILYPKRMEKIVVIDALMPWAIENPRLIPRIRSIYELADYAKDGGKTYTKDETLHALKFKRQSTLNSEAAEALFTRGVARVGDKYMYRRDPRIRRFVFPNMNFEQHMSMIVKLETPTLLISIHASTRTGVFSKVMLRMHDLFKDSGLFQIVYLTGSHDVHNNNPDRVAPHVEKFLSDDARSKL